MRRVLSRQGPYPLTIEQKACTELSLCSVAFAYAACQLDGLICTRHVMEQPAGTKVARRALLRRECIEDCFSERACSMSFVYLSLYLLCQTGRGQGPALSQNMHGRRNRLVSNDVSLLCLSESVLLLTIVHTKCYTGSRTMKATGNGRGRSIILARITLFPGMMVRWQSGQYSLQRPNHSSRH